MGFNLVCQKRICQPSSRRCWRSARFLKEKLYHAGVSRIEIARAADRARIRIHTASPGIVIGKKGSEIEALKRQLEQMVKREILIDIQEVRKPEMDATLVAENIASAANTSSGFSSRHEKGREFSPWSSAPKEYEWHAPVAWGVRRWPDVSGTGKVGCPCIPFELTLIMVPQWPRTTYGIIGVKVWIFKGDVLTWSIVSYAWGRINHREHREGLKVEFFSVL